ncbi:AAA family ATPase [Ornithinibacillus halophilus]|uniref:AAA domain (Dynein-related subfamily) n=1 Tax=Ornithinibacillus halophilus TaxID=930117 RepID=A0A1M5G2T1_9BACI|nr:AAA family ATPase [Ornithinibacillus halophilus]SHF98120.1 AAA domain (dynein-related subfamily) [Ornithinibacillus halophilus]
MPMNLMDKISELDHLEKDACWYIVRQELSFWKQCYAVSILEEYKGNNRGLNLLDFFEKRANEIAKEKGFESFITTHRMLYNAYYYGLLKKVSRDYEDAEPTNVYHSIVERCEGDFENVELYSDIVEMQIEKIFISSRLDKKYNDIRSDYKLYPLFLLLKVIVEIGQITGEYNISLEEFRTFVGTTKQYKEYLPTVFYILETRNRINASDSEFIAEYNKVKSKFNGNRYNQVLRNLPYFNVQANFISLKREYIGEIKEKLHQFETRNSNDTNYLNFLYSNESLLPQQDLNSLESGLNELNETSISKSTKFNRLVFGAPGTGKSFLLDEDINKYFKPNNVKRITFHKSMSNGQFVGTYKPRPKKENTDFITYEFVPGVFTKQLIRALKKPSEDFLVIIEELNRADAQAVFGDIFQLLDREDNGESKYPIAIPEEMYDYFVENDLEIDELILPSNFYIWTTMNTADQGVQPIDTAFTRRFDDFEYISINNNEEIISNYKVKINGIGIVNWNNFRRELNNRLLELNVKEDKLIGTFFIKERALLDSNVFQETFKNKLVFYLAENIFKHNKTKLFVENSYNKIIETYDNDKNIFNFEYEEIE